MRISRSCAIAIGLFACGCYQAHERAPHDASVDAPVSCAAQAASRTDAWMACRSATAFFWDGRTCGWIGACACSGPDCDAGHPDFDACIEAHVACFSSRACASAAECAVDQYCRREGCDRAGQCRPRPLQPLDCGFADERTCGCGGAGYGNRCRSHLDGDDATACP
jgi:hypothetical protein